MKRSYLLSIAISFLFFINAPAQEIWLEAGLKGGVGLSFLYNKNIADDDTYDYKFTPMYGFGPKFSVNFGPHHGISLEGLYHQSKQNFDYTLLNETGTQTNEITWKGFNTYLLYRYVQRGVYVELGPMYSFVQSVEQVDNGLELMNVEDNYESNYLAGVFGFGGMIAGESSTFSVSFGLRLHYGITDFVSDKGKEFGFPNPIKDTAYESDATTRPLFAQLMIGFNYGIGHFAKTGCSKRMKFFGSGRR